MIDSVYHTAAAGASENGRTMPDLGSARALVRAPLDLLYEINSISPPPERAANAVLIFERFSADPELDWSDEDFWRPFLVEAVKHEKCELLLREKLRQQRRPFQEVRVNRTKVRKVS